jgi:hypothetical protein
MSFSSINTFHSYCHNKSVVPISPSMVANIVSGGSASGNSMVYSDNGVNWKGVVNSSTIFTSWCQSIAYGSNIWVAVGGYGNTIAYSSNGINWTGLGSNIFTVYGKQVCSNGSNTFVAVGSGGNSIAYSTNGIKWTGVSAENTLFSDGSGISYGNGRWVAIQNSGSLNKNSVAYSTNILSWNIATNGNTIFLVGCIAIGFGNNMWVAAQAQGRTNGTDVAYSSDGSTWIASTGSVLNGVPITSLTYTHDLWIASSANTQNNGNIIYNTSTDAISWTTIINSNVPEKIGKLWIMNYSSKIGIWLFGINSVGNSMLYSSDGTYLTGVGKLSGIVFTICYKN